MTNPSLVKENKVTLDFSIATFYATGQQSNIYVTKAMKRWPRILYSVKHSSLKSYTNYYEHASTQECGAHVPFLKDTLENDSDDQISKELA